MKRGAPMPFVVACAVLASGCGGVKPQQRVLYPKGRVFQYSCDAVWSDMMRVFEKAGFRARASNKRAGIANFVWTNPRQPEIPGFSGGVTELVVAPSGGFLDNLSFWKSAVNVRVESAVFTMNPRPHACEVNITISYAELQSSGLLESRLLVEAGTPAPRPKRQARVRRVKAESADAAESRTSKPESAMSGHARPAVAAAIDSGRTAVYRLPSP